MSHSILSAICLISGFLFCHYVPETDYVRKNLEGADEDKTRIVILRRTLLFFFFGILPFTFIYISGGGGPDFGMNFRMPGFTIVSGLLIGLLLVFIIYMNHKSADNLKAFPQIRKKEWDIPLVILSSVSWILYLLAYEFFFRGYLLFSMVSDFGKWEAVTINVVLYSLVHLPKGFKESTGAIPLGFLFCLVSLHTGNFWSAFIAHSCMALSNEWLSLSAHPEIKVIRLK